MINHQKIKINPIFNPQGQDDVSHRSIWFGNVRFVLAKV